MREAERLAEVAQDLSNRLAHFNGLCLLISGSNELTIDKRISELVIELNELVSELKKVS